MKCLHGEPAASSTTENGSFWFCGQNPSCNFFCPEDAGYLFEIAIHAWRATKQPHPICNGHHELATMRVVKDVMKESYGRPYFVCSDKKNPCSLWGDVQPPILPMCRHGYPCVTVRWTHLTALSTCSFAHSAHEHLLICSYGPNRPDGPNNGISLSRLTHLSMSRFWHAYFF